MLRSSLAKMEAPARLLWAPEMWAAGPSHHFTARRLRGSCHSRPPPAQQALGVAVSTGARDAQAETTQAWLCCVGPRHRAHQEHVLTIAGPPRVGLCQACAHVTMSRGLAWQTASCPTTHLCMRGHPWGGSATRGDLPSRGDFSSAFLSSSASMTSSARDTATQPQGEPACLAPTQPPRSTPLPLLPRNLRAP